MKRYNAIFFDWDGTAVYSRTSPTQDVIAAMKPLLHAGVALAIISGTTIENIAGGKLHHAFTPEERQSLFYGLARGAYNYRFDENGELCTFASGVPDTDALLGIHRACFALHQWLLEEHDLPTDIVFSRPNYCKIDLMCSQSRGDQLYMQGDEIARLNALLAKHGLPDGVQTLIDKASALGQAEGLTLKATTDAKYLEVGPTLKSDNTDAIFTYLRQTRGLTADACSFWGDEFIRVDRDTYGSDSYMMTDLTLGGDFFDVSALEGDRPSCVAHIGGGVERFVGALRELGDMLAKE